MVVKNPEMRERYYKWLEVNEFSAPVMISTIGAEAAYNNGEEWLDQMLAYVEGNIDFAASHCIPMGLWGLQSTIILGLCSATTLRRPSRSIV